MLATVDIYWIYIGEIEAVMDKSDFDDVLWNGDLNFDQSRNSAFSRCVSNFLARVGLKSAWDYFPVDLTHIHTDFKSTSTLDHFVMNERLLGKITDCGVMHLGDNPSRHSPIVLKLDVGSIPVKSQEKLTKVKKPAWYKARSEDKDEFTSDLHDRLSALLEPESLHCTDPHCQDVSHSEERDSHGLDILISLIESTHKCIPLNSSSSKPADPG